MPASLASSSKMAVISSALLAAAASEEEESAENILERHMSLVFSESSPPASMCQSAQHRRLRTTSRNNYTASHVKLTHSQSAVEGHWSSSDHWSVADNCPPAFRTSTSFGDADLSRSKLRQPYCLELSRHDVDTHLHHVASVSNHRQQRHLFCPHADADRK